MKQTLLLLIAGFSMTLFAQNPTAPVQIENQTTCTLYVKLHAADIACTITTFSTVAIPPGAVWTSPVPPSGKWFDAATVSDNSSFSHGPSGCCYAERVSVPWKLCTGFASIETDDTCCENGDPAGGAVCLGLMIADFGTALSTPATPYLLVTN